MNKDKISYASKDSRIHLLSYIIVYFSSSVLFWITLGLWVVRFDALDSALDTALIDQMNQYALLSKVILLVAVSILFIAPIFVIIRADKYKKLIGIGLLIVAVIQVFWGLAVSMDHIGSYIGPFPGY